MTGCCAYWLCCSGCGYLYCWRHASQGLDQAAQGGTVVAGVAAHSAAPAANGDGAQPAFPAQAPAAAPAAVVLAPPVPALMIPAAPAEAGAGRRLLLISSRLSRPDAISAARRRGVAAAIFVWETATLGELLALASSSAAAAGGPLTSIGILSLGKAGSINLVEGSRASLQSLATRADLRQFFVELAALVAPAADGGALHLLASDLASDADGLKV